MWKDKCHICGRQIWNGVPKEISEKEGFNFDIFRKDMEKEGFTLGYNTKTIGSYFNMREVSCKPICCVCHSEELRIENEKEMKKIMKEVAKILKKQFSCPICEYHQILGYNTKVFKCASKEEMMNHIKEKHTSLRDIKEILPCGCDFNE